MSDEGKMLDLMFQTRQDVGEIKANVKNLNDTMTTSIEGLTKRVCDLEKQPAQRYNTGVNSAISATIGGAIGYLISLLTKH
jgi:hypothetical protein